MPESDKITKLLEGWIADNKELYKSLHIDIKEINKKTTELSDKMIEFRFAIDAFNNDKIICQTMMEKHDNRIKEVEDNYLKKEEYKSDVSPIKLKIENLNAFYYKTIGVSLVAIFLLNKLWPYIMKLGG